MRRRSRTVAPIRVDDVLFEDSRLRHHKALIASWEAFLEDWNKSVDCHKKFIEALAEELLSASGLPPFPAHVPGPYIMHRNLGNFIHGRLVLDAQSRLSIQENTDGPILTDGSTSVAKCTNDQIKNILEWINGIMVGRRTQAAVLRDGLEKLEKRRVAISRQLSLAIAEKKLHRSCSLASFF